LFYICQKIRIKTQTRAGQLGWNVNKVYDKNSKARRRMGEFSELRLFLYYLGHVIALQKEKGIRQGSSSMTWQRA
jgi:hypothetical protein